jgi:hypothetical protein
VSQSDTITQQWCVWPALYDTKQDIGSMHNVCVRCTVIRRDSATVHSLYVAYVIELLLLSDMILLVEHTTLQLLSSKHYNGVQFAACKREGCTHQMYRAQSARTLLFEYDSRAFNRLLLLTLASALLLLLLLLLLLHSCAQL